MRQSHSFFGHCCHSTTFKTSHGLLQDGQVYWTCVLICLHNICKKAIWRCHQVVVIPQFQCFSLSLFLLQSFCFRTRALYCNVPTFTGVSYEGVFYSMKDIRWHPLEWVRGQCESADSLEANLAIRIPSSVPDAIYGILTSLGQQDTMQEWCLLSCCCKFAYSPYPLAVKLNWKAFFTLSSLGLSKTAIHKGTSVNKRDWLAKMREK